MYRAYENPRILEDELNELKKEYNDIYTVAKAKGFLAVEWDILSDMAQDIAELEERINFAWQDDEYDMSE